MRVMAAHADLYEVLGIRHDATLEEIRRLYRRQSLRPPSDNCSGRLAEAERRFRRLTDAYKTIMRLHRSAARAHQHRREGRTLSPGDLAAMDFDWHIAGVGCTRGFTTWIGRGCSHKRSYANVNEPRAFLWSWALAIVLGLGVSMLMLEAGVVGPPAAELGGADLALLAATAVAVYAGVLACALVALVCTRTIICLTVRLGLRLLPSLPGLSRRGELPAEATA